MQLTSDAPNLDTIVVMMMMSSMMMVMLIFMMREVVQLVNAGDELELATLGCQRGWHRHLMGVRKSPKINKEIGGD